MKAREALLQSDLLGEDLKKIVPIVREGAATARSSTTCSSCW